MGHKNKNHAAIAQRVRKPGGKRVRSTKPGGTPSNQELIAQAFDRLDRETRKRERAKRTTQ